MHWNLVLFSSLEVLSSETRVEVLQLVLRVQRLLVVVPSCLVSSFQVLRVRVVDSHELYLCARQTVEVVV